MELDRGSPPANLSRPWPRRLGQALGLLALATGLGACPATPQKAGTGFAALVPSGPDSVARIDVRQLEARPRLALVVREGDPAPALVLTAYTATAPAATVAVATLVELRLRQANFDVELVVDRMAFRLIWWPASDERVEAFMAAAALAFRQPAQAMPDLLEAIAQRFAALRRHPLDAAPLVSIARCTGELGLAPPAAAELETEVTLPMLESWRRQGLAVRRTALAAVGPESFAEAALAALQEDSVWPEGPPWSAPPVGSDSAEAYRSPEIGHGTARLHLAVDVTDPQRAANVVERLGTRPSPLLAKLATLPEPWRLEQLHGTARPTGGCISGVLTPRRAAGQRPANVESAARAAALWRDEIRRGLADPANPRLITSQIANAPDPRDAAQRAAWWSLASPPDEPGEAPLSAVLALPIDPDQAEEASADALSQRYATELARHPPATTLTPLAERRVRVERGQGQVWALLASPCALQHEGPNESGAAALAVLSASRGVPRAAGVWVEPWIDPGGVGLIAHAGPRSPAETPLELARRVGRVLGRATAAEAIRRPAFVAVKRRTVNALQDGELRYLERFCGRAVPDHPSWLRPIGPLDRHVALPRRVVERRWHEALRAPLRLAIIANASAEQAEALAREVDRWLLPSGGAGTCPQRAEPTAGRAGTLRLDRTPDGPQHVLLGASLVRPDPADRHAVELTAEVLADPSGPLAALNRDEPLADGWSAQALGGDQVVALLISVAAAPGKTRALERGLAETVERLRTEGFEPTLGAQAIERLALRRRREALDPRRRLADAWRAPRPTPPPPTQERWNRWLGTLLAPERLLIVAPPLAD